ncbi:heavy-metal-associated domain-containing protein [Neomegalonema sp.]|uniref:heavy-metal-associated domain-containing protein n=1 Tax=Neomegalonema sp. TaxID=2039713 RepID=UPI00260F2750|nr:heavy-metal-associated domain-containing protein [Neomegalonema sp.]MDD2868411.1 heavy-metal-associated domain-containing protein [Neomegalonema sp.]
MRLHVEDMACGGCARSVKAAILGLDAQARVEADPATRILEVETSAPLADLRKVLAEAGFPATAV